MTFALTVGAIVDRVDDFLEAAVAHVLAMVLAHSLVARSRLASLAGAVALKLSWLVAKLATLVLERSSTEDESRSVPVLDDVATHAAMPEALRISRIRWP